MTGREQVEVTSREQLRAWLLDNHAQGEGVWLVTWKKAAGGPDRYLSTDDVLDELTAFGWTDGPRRRVDDERTSQLVSPRRTRAWAKSYRDRAERLVAQGLMHPSGQAGVDHAKADGQWDAMPDVDALVVPDDLAAALAACPGGAEGFAAFPPSVRRNVLRWIASARTPPTRSRRVQTTVLAAREGRRPSSHG